MNGGAEKLSVSDAEARWIGWTALALAVLSLFFFGAAFGPAAAVAGMIAFFLGQRAIGVWSAAIGFMAFLASIV